ncbi:MAG TPA: hypothetical protein VNH84_10760, partial [Candidatus Saccharimonadales bacterium]|nr:hypothetical protein [Candidatus Saccharimonadales bacterium]
PRLAEEALRAEFVERQNEFTRALQTVFGHPVPLLTVETKSRQFEQAVEAFRERRSNFFLPPALTEFWAFGDSGDQILNQWLGRLRRFTNGYVRADVLPGGERLTTASVRLMEAESLAQQLSLATVDKQGRDLPVGQLRALAQVQQDALRGVPADERALVQFLAAFFHPSCVFDEALTRQARARRTEVLLASDRYEAGQVVIAQGERVTPKIQLALDELRNRLEVDHAQAIVAAERTARARAETEVVATRQAAATTETMNRWLQGGLAAAAVLCLLLIWAWVRIRRSRRAEAPASEMALVVQSDDSVAAGEWRQRALAAEATAQKATALLRSNLLSHMARWMMTEFLQRLLSQRSVILTSQQKAEKEVADLASRLDQLHAPLEERLQAYARRIAELEAELASKGEQNVELIKAKIESTRKHLEEERSTEPGPLNWN